MLCILVVVEVLWVHVSVKMKGIVHFSVLPDLVSTIVPCPDLGIQVVFNRCMQNEGDSQAALNQGDDFAWAVAKKWLSQHGGQVQL